MLHFCNVDVSTVSCGKLIKQSLAANSATGLACKEYVDQNQPGKLHYFATHCLIALLVCLHCSLFFSVSSYVVLRAMLPDANKWMDG